MAACNSGQCCHHIFEGAGIITADFNSIAHACCDKQQQDCKCRLQQASFLFLCLGSGEHREVCCHQDFQDTFPGNTRTTFKWLPLVNSLTASLHTW